MEMKISVGVVSDLASSHDGLSGIDDIHSENWHLDGFHPLLVAGTAVSACMPRGATHCPMLFRRAEPIGASEKQPTLTGTAGGGTRVDDEILLMKLMLLQGAY